MSPGESYGQLDPIWNSQLIGRYNEMSAGESYGQLDPIWNSQLIGRYKEMSPGESYGQLDPIWKSQLTGRYKEMSLGESNIWNCQSTEWTLHFSMWSMRAHLKQSTNRKISRNVTRWILQYNPPFETGRAQSELFTFQCSQWELIWNSQLIGRYKEMSPGESYGQWELIWNSQLIARYKEMSPGESYGQWELIWNSQLIGRYKEMSPGESYIWNWQSTEWTLWLSMRSMRAHLKQSTNRKI